MKKKISIILFIMFLTISILEINKTYSLFETNSSGEVTSKIAKWQILVNSNDITNNTESQEQFNLGKLTWNENEHVRDGKGAPGLESTLNITIDPTNTEVSFKYEITIDLTDFQDQLSISSITETGGNELVQTGKYSYTGVFALKDIQNKKKHNIELKINWQDKEENNNSDINLGLEAQDGLNLPVTFHATQYRTGDIIEEYIPGSDSNEVVG